MINKINYKKNPNTSTWAYCWTLLLKDKTLFLGHSSKCQCGTPAQVWDSWTPKNRT